MNHGSDDSDILKVTRPSWMDQQTWARIKTGTEALLEKPFTPPAISGDCSERTWCISSSDDHEDFHASNIVELAGSDGSGGHGWWCWLSEDRDPGEAGLQLRIEGRIVRSDGADNFYASFDVSDAVALLRAIASPDARLALQTVLTEVTGAEL